GVLQGRGRRSGQRGSRCLVGDGLGRGRSPDPDADEVETGFRGDVDELIGFKVEQAEVGDADVGHWGVLSKWRGCRSPGRSGRPVRMERYIALIVLRDRSASSPVTAGDRPVRTASTKSVFCSAWKGASDPLISVSARSARTSVGKEYAA